MILTCPNCGTQYVVKDGAIPPEGRQVRCASCKHSWHQDPDRPEEPELSSQEREMPSEPAVTPEGLAQEGGDESLAQAALIEPRSGPEAEERAYEEAVIDGSADRPSEDHGGLDERGETDPASSDQADVSAPDWREPPTGEDSADMFTPFAEDEEQPARRSRAGAIIIVILVIIAAAAAFWFLAPPTLKAKLGLASGGATPLQLVTTHMDRQHLESGNDLLTLTGRVINPSGKEQVVPPIQAQLKNRSGKVVYSWTIQPPAQTLPAGGSAPFNSAEVSVPPSGDELTITLGDGKAPGA
jgi:predicted Zn finger-like uncharacterized protein